MNDETKTETLETLEKPAARPARKGKIARLPAAVREELNQRLLDGEAGPSLLQWLNELPEVQAELQGQYGGRPVTEQNLSEWRQGGFRDWLARTEAAESMAETLAEVPASHRRENGEEALADRVAGWFFPHYVAAARGRLSSAPTPEDRWSVLRTICSDLAVLRRSEHYVERLKIWREKLELEAKEGAGTMKEKFINWARKQPDIEKLICPLQQGNLNRLTPKSVSPLSFTVPRGRLV